MNNMHDTLCTATWCVVIKQCLSVHSSTEKTKNLLFNGTRAVMGRIWKVDSEGKCADTDVCDHSEAPPAHNQLLLKGQTLIGLDGKLKRASVGSGKTTLHCTHSFSVVGCGLCFSLSHLVLLANSLLYILIIYLKIREGGANVHFLQSTWTLASFKLQLMQRHGKLNAQRRALTHLLYSACLSSRALVIGPCLCEGQDGVSKQSVLSWVRGHQELWHCWESNLSSPDDGEVVLFLLPGTTLKPRLGVLFRPLPGFDACLFTFWVNFKPTFLQE